MTPAQQLKRWVTLPAAIGPTVIDLSEKVPLFSRHERPSPRPWRPHAGTPYPVPENGSIM
jgi:hypothetical protein